MRMGAPVPIARQLLFVSLHGSGRPCLQRICLYFEHMLLHLPLILDPGLSLEEIELMSAQRVRVWTLNDVGHLVGGNLELG